jgi:hypothetical protein
MPWAYNFFSHTASKTRFLSRLSASIFLSSVFSRSSSFESLGLVDLNLAKLSLPPVEGYLGEVVFPAHFRDRFAFVSFPQNADFFLCRISLAFHRLGPFVQTPD